MWHYASKSLVSNITVIENYCGLRRLIYIAINNVIQQPYRRKWRIWKVYGWSYERFEILLSTSTFTCNPEIHLFTTCPVLTYTLRSNARIALILAENAGKIRTSFSPGYVTLNFCIRALRASHFYLSTLGGFYRYKIAPKWSSLSS